jgi:isopentenyl diphosphate isomerase/L-lactate dehydrogenase-like FMN-dependent dehydrogenase
MLKAKSNNTVFSAKTVSSTATADMARPIRFTDYMCISEDILNEVKEVAAGYGVTMLRADVKDLVSPGNLQEVMNRVLAAERTSQVQLVEARTKAETQKLEAQTKTDAVRLEAEIASSFRRFVCFLFFTLVQSGYSASRSLKLSDPLR